MLKSIEGEEDRDDVGEGNLDYLGKKAETPVHRAEF
jgi:hypothetical protein